MKTSFKIEIKGLVQGVGFRPALYRHAKALGLTGLICNTSQGVLLFLEGDRKDLESFLKAIPEIKPTISRIETIKVEEVAPQNFSTLQIVGGKDKGVPTVEPTPDLAICPECLGELFEPQDRRYLYPFINCTQCGPRFSIMTKLPYERQNTTMKIFNMCPQCREEYENPLNRRFHAEPIACALCGPRAILLDKQGKKLAEHHEAISLAAQYLREGIIIALKGLTGFHLLTRADSNEAVEKLRLRKKRPQKPLAVMFRDLEHLKNYVHFDLDEEALTLLTGQSSPILVTRATFNLPSSLSGGLNSIGIFLAYTPLHRLIFSIIDFPLIATSGNLSEEPIVYDEREALEKLKSVADLFLIHNRPIQRPFDDSVFKKMGPFYVPLRISRGFSPLTIFLRKKTSKTILAFGAQEKSTFAIATGSKIILGPHVGDLDNSSVEERFKKLVEDHLRFYSVTPELLIADLHPSYLSTRLAREWAEKEGLPLRGVQHHHAHILSVLAEKQLEPEEVLGIAWDGTGYGTDGTIWGGEFLSLQGLSFRRISSLRKFRLLGGERAVKDTRRVALSLLFEIYGEETLTFDLPFIREFSSMELSLLYQMWKKGLNSPQCTSVGRLFDGVSALLGICCYNSYSGEGASRLESLYDWEIKTTYPFDSRDSVIDWEPLIRTIMESKEDKKVKASKFINTLAQMIRSVAISASIPRIALSGGVFMNEPLLIGVKTLLEKEGFAVIFNQKVPPNDGGISLGQAYFGVLSLRE
ncbi:MAG: carbamoyltransferase HypF [Caldimicrobium sp.]|nr:carbamoyltransferase HypF [Caldimicrobium sp.]MCX7613058.1 carbamoyltransferase HypF [Caldimicrobium sp.]MDW8182791.1 carbamoyltransferase HypF [Caldimicrobium sp.]